MQNRLSTREIGSSCTCINFVDGGELYGSGVGGGARKGRRMCHYMPDQDLRPKNRKYMHIGREKDLPLLTELKEGQTGPCQRLSNAVACHVREIESTEVKIFTSKDNHRISRGNPARDLTLRSSPPLLSLLHVPRSVHPVTNIIGRGPAFGIRFSYQDPRQGESQTHSEDGEPAEVASLILFNGTLSLDAPISAPESDLQI